MVICFIVLGILLVRANRKGHSRSNTHPHPVLRFFKFFFQYVFFEIITLPFTIAGIIALESGRLPANFDSTAIRIVYYVFFSLKYSLVIFIGLYENVGLYRLSPSEQEDMIRARWTRIGHKLHLPGTWITMAEVGGVVDLPVCGAHVRLFSAI